MNNVVDEILQDEPTYRILDNQGNILYDNISIEMITAITQMGTALNKALFDSIKTDLDSRLLISDKATQSEAQTGANNTKYMTALRVEQHYTNKKATQAQAEAGTDNDKLMTSLRVKQAIEAFKNIKYHSITLSKSAETTVNISNYITDTTIKLEIVINADFEDSHGGVSFTGTRFTSAGKSTGSSSLDLDHTNQKANLTIAIFPKQHKISVIGIGNPSVTSETIFNDSYSYETITSMQIGRLDSSTYLNYDEPASIIQYLN